MLNQAEQKVQMRLSPPSGIQNSNDSYQQAQLSGFSMPEKYFLSSNSFGVDSDQAKHADSMMCGLKVNSMFSFNHNEYKLVNTIQNLSMDQQQLQENQPLMRDDSIMFNNGFVNPSDSEGNNY